MHGTSKTNSIYYYKILNRQHIKDIGFIKTDVVTQKTVVKYITVVYERTLALIDNGFL